MNHKLARLHGPWAREERGGLPRGKTRPEQAQIADPSMRFETAIFPR